MRTQIDVHDYERIILLEGESARACALDILFYSILEKAVQEKENECSILAEQICTHECKITKRAREREKIQQNEITCLCPVYHRFLHHFHHYHFVRL